jgi:hypothetical protein
MAIAIAGVLDVDQVLAPVQGAQVLQRLDKFDGPSQGAAGRRLFQVRQHRRWPRIHQREDVRFGQRLFFYIATLAHPAAHLPGCIAGERQATDAPAHRQVAHELRRHAFDVGQLLAFIPMLEGGRRFGGDVNLRRP